jgi:hypothetical protein
VSPVKYELGFHIPEDGILHSDRRDNLKSYIFSASCEACRAVGQVPRSTVPRYVLTHPHLSCTPT